MLFLPEERTKLLHSESMFLFIEPIKSYSERLPFAEQQKFAHVVETFFNIFITFMNFQEFFINIFPTKV